MKKLLLLTLTFLSISAKAQELKDLIVTIKGDSIKCKITKVEKNWIYYDYIARVSVKNKYICVDDIKYYVMSGIKTKPGEIKTKEIAGTPIIDSELTLKLKNAKSLKDSNLISQQEYDQLKSKILNVPTRIPVDTLILKQDLKKLRKKYNGQCFVAATFGLGCAGAIYGSFLAAKEPIQITYDNQGNIDYKKYSDDLENKKNNVITLYVCSGILGAFSIVNIVGSQITQHKSIKLKNTLSLHLDGSGVSIAYSF
ncbi:MAG: SHOCT domain-containing protein [Bacteroidota bacterium]|nr:SHOCT domain-containing protein [Bacteroidota bacterium]